jgi:SagB-type dehydrogenase family enzyme
MDPSNVPAPFKRHPGAAIARLPTDLPHHGAAAAEVLSGRARPASAGVDIRLLARLLFFSGGVTRVAGPAWARTSFRAAASAGNLHPLETYLVCADLPGLDAGVYHFAPEAFALERLRGGDHRDFTADATADPGAATAPAVLVVTGIPWRSAWKYAERGWRHVYWDAGTMLANLLAVADGYGVGARLLFGFRDAALCRLLGVDGVVEFPLAAVVLPGDTAPGGWRPPAPTQAGRRGPARVAWRGSSPGAGPRSRSAPGHGRDPSSVRRPWPWRVARRCGSHARRGRRRRGPAARLAGRR